jgi:hypothetical protein
MVCQPKVHGCDLEDAMTNEAQTMLLLKDGLLSRGRIRAGCLLNRTTRRSRQTAGSHEVYESVFAQPGASAICVAVLPHCALIDIELIAALSP